MRRPAPAPLDFSRPRRSRRLSGADPSLPPTLASSGLISERRGLHVAVRGNQIPVAAGELRQVSVAASVGRPADSLAEVNRMAQAESTFHRKRQPTLCRLRLSFFLSLSQSLFGQGKIGGRSEQVRAAARGNTGRPLPAEAAPLPNGCSRTEMVRQREAIATFCNDVFGSTEAVDK